MVNSCHEETAALVLSCDDDSNDADVVCLPSSASSSFWLTGVFDGHLLPSHCAKKGGDEDQRQRQDRQGNKQEVERSFYFHDNFLGRDDDENGNEEQTLSRRYKGATTSVVWLHGAEAINTVCKGCKRKSPTLSQATSEALLPPSKVPVHLVDETVLCNLVPFLPRTFARFGLVSQIVPCTLWPLPVNSSYAAEKVACLQEAAAIASRMHHNLLRASSDIPSFFPSASPVGVLVEWAAGDVSYTTDTEGLWAEQRVVQERYYHLPPLIKVTVGGGEGTPNRQEERVAVRLQKPPLSLTSVVREQLRRFCHVEEEKIRQQRRDRWLPCFARLLAVSPECAARLERLTINRHAMSSSVFNASSCDALLDELVFVGIVPDGEPHRLSLLCLSEAYRMLTAVERDEHREQPQFGNKCAGFFTDTQAVNTKTITTNLEETTSTQSVAESLLNLILLALTDSLCRRITVQYELLRLLRIKVMALPQRDLAIQYTRWYAGVPAPSAVLHLLAGSTLFALLVARRWPRYQQQRSAVVRGGLCAKRRRLDEGLYEENDSDNNSKSERKEENKDDEKKETEEVHPKSNSCTGENITRSGDGVEIMVTVGVPFETDLLADDYLTRFAAWLRAKGSGTVGQRKMNDIGINTGADGAAIPVGIGVAAGVCDETALAATLGCLRKRKRTMTLKELYAFVRSKR